MSNVTHPAHYNSGKIEVIEAIEDWKLNFHRGNAVKYIARAGKKDPYKYVEDLEKAIWYLRREIELDNATREGRAATRPNDMNPQKEDASGFQIRSAEKAFDGEVEIRGDHPGSIQRVRERDPIREAAREANSGSGPFDRRS